MKLTNVLSLAIVIAVLFGGIFFYEIHHLSSMPHKLSQSILSTTSTTKAISTASSTKITMATNNTSGWTTYRNEKYGFEVKLPDGWHVLKDDSGTLSPHANFQFTDPTQWSGEFNIHILPSIGDLRAVAALNEYGNHEERIATSFHNLPAIQVNSSIHIDEKKPYDLTYETLFVKRGQYTFILSITTETSGTTSQKEARTILSTFQFISSLTNGSKLKTYYGFSGNDAFTIQYPSNLKIQKSFDTSGAYGNSNSSICNEEICAKFLETSMDSTPKKTPPPAFIKNSSLYHSTSGHLVGENAFATMYKIKSSHYIPSDCSKKYNIFSYYVASTTNPLINSMIATLKFNISSTSADSSNRKETSPLGIPNSRTYHNDKFGFTLTYSNNPNPYGIGINNPAKPNIVYINSTSTITFDPVAENSPAVYLFPNPSKFRSLIYTSTGTQENIVYAPKNKQFVITSNAKVPECPEHYSTNRNAPYYTISTGIHAGSTIDVYITTNGIIVSAGEVYRDSRGDFYEDPITFDNPQSVIKATYLVVPK